MSTGGSHEPDEVILTADGSRTLARPGAESFKSRAGALTEARQVYLEGSGVGERLREGQPTRLLELGFGTGLLFLVTATLAAEHGAALDYVAVERRPPPPELLEALGYAELLAPSSVPRALLEWWREDVLGMAAEGTADVHHLEHGTVSLTLHVADALTHPYDSGDGSKDGSKYGYDAIYHDAFSPATNPEMWQPAFLKELAGRLRPGGRLVSFTVAGAVRRALSEAGLEARKVPGPTGGKREVLVAERPK